MRELDGDDNIHFRCLHCVDVIYPHYTSLIRHLQSQGHPSLPDQNDANNGDNGQEEEPASPGPPNWVAKAEAVEATIMAAARATLAVMAIVFCGWETHVVIHNEYNAGIDAAAEFWRLYGAKY
ncbi:hypothetical protein OC834_002297 [Tilletia horrida]|nr:hypothetical protein OC834_002297 [Tilletia horrida]